MPNRIPYLPCMVSLMKIKNSDQPAAKSILQNFMKFRECYNKMMRIVSSTKYISLKRHQEMTLCKVKWHHVKYHNHSSHKLSLWRNMVYRGNCFSKMVTATKYLQTFRCFDKLRTTSSHNTEGMRNMITKFEATVS